MITGSLWHVKTQLSFFQQVNPDLVKTILALDDASPVKHHVVNILEQTRKSTIEKKKNLIGKSKEKLPVKNTESNVEPTV